MNCKWFSCMCALMSGTPMSSSSTTNHHHSSITRKAQVAAQSTSFQWKQKCPFYCWSTLCLGGKGDTNYIQIFSIELGERAPVSLWCFEETKQNLNIPGFQTDRQCQRLILRKAEGRNKVWWVGLGTEQRKSIILVTFSSLSGSQRPWQDWVLENTGEVDRGSQFHHEEV